MLVAIKAHGCSAIVCCGPDCVMGLDQGGGASALLVHTVRLMLEVVNL
jgi:hypothetical protein